MTDELLRSIRRVAREGLAGTRTRQGALLEISRLASPPDVHVELHGVVFDEPPSLDVHVSGSADPVASMRMPEGTP